MQLSQGPRNFQKGVGTPQTGQPPLCGSLTLTFLEIQQEFWSQLLLVLVLSLAALTRITGADINGGFHKGVLFRPKSVLSNFPTNSKKPTNGTNTYKRNQQLQTEPKPTNGTKTYKRNQHQKRNQQQKTYKRFDLKSVLSIFWLRSKIQPFLA